MQYVGIHTQQARNNLRSFLLLLFFPCIILAAVYAFLYCVDHFSSEYSNPDAVNRAFLNTLPWVLGIIGIWFLISYFANASMVRLATGARPLQRRENPRVYNIVENLTMACGMPMPKVNVIDDPQLNAFASGIDKNSYTVTVTTGICNRLNDDELAGVIAHELTHIRNRDTRLLIVSIIFVGIMGTVLNIATRMLWNAYLFGDNRRSSRDEKNGNTFIPLLVIAIILAAIGYLLTMLTRFAISRKREYMADAGGAELCGNPLALASALRKISGDPGLGSIDREDIAQLYIVRPKAFASKFTEIMSNLFSTHPKIEKRIAYLEQF